MYPRHVLPAAGDGPPDPELEEGQHLLERATIGIQHHTRAYERDPQPGFGGLQCLAFPGSADPREKIVARWRVLGDQLVTMLAVVADGARRHQRRRWLLGGA